jgi:quinol monooxygenase YgiN
MSSLTLIAQYQVNPGRIEELKALATDYVAQVERTEPGCASLALHFDDEKRFDHVLTMQDADAMEEHVVRVRPFLERSADLVIPETLTVYGSPGPALQSALNFNASRGARTEVVPGPGIGFLRR